MLKQVFRQGKDLQEEITLLFDVLSTKLDDIFNLSDKKNIINRHQTKNTTSF